MKKVLIFIFFTLLFTINFKTQGEVLSAKSESSYWLTLFRKSDVEILYFGAPGDPKNSFLIKAFKVNSGVPNEKPTPLPKLLGREYWLITEKIEDKENLETSPYFLSLNIPVTEEEPYGPTPYLECSGQCNWDIPGSFGLHGTAGDESRLLDAGSSGCIRHKDLDITFLYNVLKPEESEIRYYVEDI